MNNKKSEISIIGFGTVSSIMSLVLADNKIGHSYYIKKSTRAILDLPPLSNPIVNGPTRYIEEKFLTKEYVSAIPYIQNYKSISLDENFNEYRVIFGEYKTETYAIDNRIRLHCFLEQLKKNGLINLIEFEEFENVMGGLNSSVNIIGNGGYKSIFADIQKLTVPKLIKNRELFYFNLVCDKFTYKKFWGKVQIYYIANIGEILIYPFLHPSGEQALNLTINVIKGSKWDVFSNVSKGRIAFNLLIEILKTSIPELAAELVDCSILEDHFELFKTEPYYKKSITYYHNKLFFGIGEAISKSDPLIGQGYNSGLNMGLKMIDLIKMERALNIVEDEYLAYTSKMLEYLYHINNSLTQLSENKYLNNVYDAAVNNKNLRDLLFSTFNDITLYFPWLIDEDETKKMLEKYKLIK